MDATHDPQDPAPAPAGTDPAAPREVKLPSGLTVTLRSDRSLRRSDIHQVWAAITSTETAVPEMHDALIELLVTASSDQRHPVPFTADALDLLDPDDYLALWSAVQPAYDLVNGKSPLPRPTAA